ncbi:MAG TPA: translocation/assembly module TamB domain-containing protein [Acetobacteraceae bacterium]|nr:translocation/assembly module TamB domain-containing protein [Acetobacteraceae bacterium]
MRRAAKWLAWILGILIALPVLLVTLVMISANTDAGRRLIEQETASLTGGMVRIAGLAGRFPDALRVARIDIADAAGVYLTVEDVALDWSPTRLIRRNVLIDRLTARHINFARMPLPGGTSSGSYSLPVQVDLKMLRVDRMDIGQPVAGQAVALAIDGSAQVRTLTTGSARIEAHRLDGQGTYALDAEIDPAHMHATIKADEPPHGLIAGLATLPDLGALAIDATIDGPRTALATKVSVNAGPLRAAANGTVDLVHQAGDLSLSAHAPAMTPRPDIAWQSVAVDAKVHGNFTRPEAAGTVRIAALSAAGASIDSLNADLDGNAGEVRLHATADGIRVPGPQPALLSGAPLVIDATARLDAPDRPVTFSIHHKLLTADGSARTEGTLSLQLAVTLPDLAPLAAAGGADVQGRADLHLNAAAKADETTLAVTGTVGVTGGMAPLPALIGDAGRIDVAASLRGQDVTLSRLVVGGKAFDASAHGGLTNGVADLDWVMHLADLAAVQPSLAGTLEANGHVAGKTDDLAVAADLRGAIEARGYHTGQVTAHVDAQGLPNAPVAKVTAEGTLLDSPLALAVQAEERDGAIHLTIDKADWKTAHAEGSVSLAQGATIPTGKLQVGMTRLADLEPLVGKPIAGSASATLDSDAQAARLTATARGVTVPGLASIPRADLNATINDPAGHPAVDGTLAIDGASVGGTGLSGRLTAKGPADALAVTLSASSPDAAGAPAKIDAAGTLDAMGRTLGLARMQATWKQEALRLLAPVKIGFANGVSIDRLRLGLRSAELDLSGRADKTLDLTARLQNLPVDIAAVVAPSLAADGTVSAEARLTGTPSQPEGTVRINASGVRLRSGPGRSLPAASLAATANLARTSMRVDTKLTAGRSHLTLTGTAPLTPSGALDLRAGGLLDLAVLDPVLTAEGRRVRGQVTLDAGITGTTARPRINGSARLANGEAQDFGMGAHVTDLSALVEADGDTIRLSRLTGRAGPGTIGASGTVGLAGDMPVSLTLTANNARPLASDLLTALIDANLTLQGALKGDLTAGGTLHVRRADIRVPEHMPASVAVLKVRDAGAPPPPPAPAAPPMVIALNLILDAPSQVFIRGRGLDVELGGRVHIRGTTAKPEPDGGLNLRRGTLSVVGSTLTFTEGSINFTGAGITDPSIHLVATSTTATIVATLTVSGSARDPKITLSSVPDLPQDEILAQLLFNTSTSKLSPFQIAEIGAALASLSGAGPGGGGPLDNLRSKLGLDRLSVGSGTNGAPALEAGRYLAPGVYLGAKQSASGGGTQATVQIDLAKGLKLETTAGSGASSATGSSGSADAASVGVTYQFEY